MKTFEPLLRELPSKWSKKHYLEKVFATRFLSVGKPYKTNGKRGSSKCKKRIAETLIKPVENEDFWAPFAPIALKMIKKHYLEKVFATRFLSVGKPYKTNGKRGFSECKKRMAETLIKPVENEAFWAPFARIAIKMIKKHYLT